MPQPTDHHPRTRAITAGLRRSQYGEMAEALFMTQGFAYDSAASAEARFTDPGADEYIYARYNNPTTRIFEERIAAIEGTEDAFATASGMAAIHGALMSMARPGLRIVAARAMFGSILWVLEFMQGLGVEVTLVDGKNLDDWARALENGADVVFFETLSNPQLELVDLARLAPMAHAAGALVMVDNVFTTPVFSRAVELGADVVLYSATKHIDGAGRALGGVICGTRAFIREQAEPYLKHSGCAISPFNAWLMLGGLTSMDLRVRAMADSALEIARQLEGHKALARVIYPGLPSHPQHDLCMAQMGSGGTMLALDVAGGKEAAFAVLDRLRLITLSNNLGDAKSIATHPATTTHQRLGSERQAELGITPGLIRLSVGLEDPRDLMGDLLTALGG